MNKNKHYRKKLWWRKVPEYRLTLHNALKFSYAMSSFWVQLKTNTLETHLSPLSGKENISEMLINSTSMQLITQENWSAFTCHESLKSYSICNDFANSERMKYISMHENSSGWKLKFCSKCSLIKIWNPFSYNSSASVLSFKL